MVFVCLFNVLLMRLTDPSINTSATIVAAPWATVAPYLEPIIKIVYKLGLALCETTDDIKDIKAGYGVALTKGEGTWVTPTIDLSFGMQITRGEYLRWIIPSTCDCF